MIKKILIGILIASSFANATKKVNMFCRFDALAVGYKSSTHSTNLILVEPNNDQKLKLYNDDGSGNNRFDSKQREKSIQAYGSDHFYVFDGETYQHFRISFDGYTNDVIKYAKLFYRNTNSGTFTCMLTEEWSPEYYKYDNE